jgi:hypothetical protein
MAARIRKQHQDEVRARIQASQLVNVLQNHALGKTKAKLSPSRLKAIEILLKKSIPDLTSTELKGDPDNPIQVSRIERVVVDPAK